MVAGAAWQGFLGAAFETVELVFREQDVTGVPGAIGVERTLGADEEVAPSAHGVTEHTVFRWVFLGIESEVDRGE